MPSDLLIPTTKYNLKLPHSPVFSFLRQIRRYLAEKLAAEDLMIELGKEVERLRSETGPALPTTSPEALRLEELHQELEDLRHTNKSLIEQNEELQAMMLTRGVEEGRNLLNGTSNSLAQELGELNERQVNHMDTLYGLKTVLSLQINTYQRIY